jgi:hypothetical protein
MTRQSLKEESCGLDSFTCIYESKALSVSRLHLGKEGGYEVSTRQKAEFQENSATPQPIETAIVTHGVKIISIYVRQYYYQLHC